MKRLLILTKRNCDDALWFAGHVQKQPDWEVEVETSNINYWNDNWDYGDLFDYDLIWMYYYPHIIKPHVLQLNGRWLNTHPSYLPFNRGSAPNFFSIVTNTPAGVSVHKVTEKLDRGDILAREEIFCNPAWTGEDLYAVLGEEALQLTIDTFHEIKDIVDNDYEWDRLGTEQGKLINPGVEQHTTRQFHETRNLTSEFERTKSLNHIMRIIRAATFEGYEGAYFYDDDGHRVEIKGTFRVLE